MRIPFMGWMTILHSSNVLTLCFSAKVGMEWPLRSPFSFPRSYAHGAKSDTGGLADRSLGYQSWNTASELVQICMLFIFFVKKDWMIWMRHHLAVEAFDIPLLWRLVSLVHKSEKSLQINHIYNPHIPHLQSKTRQLCDWHFLVFQVCV